MVAQNWLRVNAYCRKYSRILGLSEVYIKQSISRGKCITRRYRVSANGKLRKAAPGVTLRGRQLVEVLDAPPDLPPRETYPLCIKCNRVSNQSRGGLSLGGVCYRCKKQEVRSPGVKAGPDEKALAIMQEHSDRVRAKWQQDRSDPDLWEDRQARVAAHAARIEAMGLCGDGENWID